MEPSEHSKTSILAPEDESAGITILTAFVEINRRSFKKNLNKRI